MINLITNTSNIQNIQNTNRFSKSPVSFRGSASDVFVKSKESDMSEKYSQVDSSLDMKAISEKYAKKTKILPLVMDRIMHGVGKYIKQERDINQFTQDFLDDSSTLAKRIGLGADSEEYCACYAPELTMIKGISPLCNDYKLGGITKQNFDRDVEACVVEYTNDDSVRQKHFLK